MRITLESDYALRIITALAESDELIDAKSLSDKTQVTLRFTLKILHKLVGGDLVASAKGSKGGYKLKRDADKITLRDVIELIDGPIFIARCLEGEGVCSLNQDKSACIYHQIFDRISFDVSSKLQGITIQDIITRNYTL